MFVTIEKDTGSMYVEWHGTADHEVRDHQEPTRDHPGHGAMDDYTFHPHRARVMVEDLCVAEFTTDHDDWAYLVQIASPNIADIREAWEVACL